MASSGNLRWAHKEVLTRPSSPVQPAVSRAARWARVERQPGAVAAGEVADGPLGTSGLPAQRSCFGMQVGQAADERSKKDDDLWSPALRGGGHMPSRWLPT